MTRRKRNHVTRLMGMSLVIILAIGCIGCGFSGKKETQKLATEIDAITPTDDTLTVVGVSQVGSESVWRTANTTSIQNTFTKENGYFLIFDNARQKQENQIKAIRSFISQQVDYIVFSPITETGWDTVLQEAKEAGIPVILMDRMVQVADDSLYTSWVGSNFEEEGIEAGQWLEKDLSTKGRDQEDIQIVVLQGTEGATSMIGRTEGFQQIADSKSNWHILEMADAEYTTAKGREVMKQMLETYPDIDVVVSQNDDMTFGALEAIHDAGKTTGVDGDIEIISFDAVKAALKLVEKGIINVDIECNPNQGELVNQVIEALEKGEQVPKKNYIEEQVVTQDNVKEILKNRTY